ncbi:hypothetical protein N5U23_04590 [Aliarcobacter butzleri]|uniref:hypothetical protein n=1 Tax=Aliarcobacter butzleri TaxID=28197 RepID=UPI0021B4779B|nr:hypothetical protein [Aliarcobacter butzleri]MCT7563290.1 hypothetical protein [Aliarcobacter butzleri]MCT7648904.1 hypothetical protein [Aliarcobacter butzleri]
MNKIGVLYICEKLNLCLLDEKIYESSEDVNTVVNDLEYLKMNFLDIKDKPNYKLFYVNNFNVFKKDINKFINLDFGKDSRGVSKFLIKDNIKKEDLDDILNANISEHQLQIDDIKHLIHYKIMGFAPSIIYTIDSSSIDLGVINTDNLIDYNSIYSN